MKTTHARRSIVAPVVITLSLVGGSAEPSRALAPPLISADLSIGLLSLAFGPWQSPESRPAESLMFRLDLSHAFYGTSLRDRVIARIDLIGSAVGSSARRPLNAAMVFDSSGSMQEDQKFAHAMQAAKLAIENLSTRDVVSLVIFSDRAVVLSPAGRAVNKEFLNHRLSEIGPQGWTNLSAGLLEGLAQIDSQRDEQQLKRVILLTDGMANRGITDVEKLRRIVASANKRGISVSTLGVGTKFDEKLLTALAEAGGGRYTYVASAEQIPAAVAAELNGMLEVVGQNAKLELQVSGGRISRVYDRRIESPGASYAVDLGDIRDGERSELLVELTPDRRQAGAKLAVAAKLIADDPQSGTRRELVSRGECSFSDDERRVRAGENAGIVTCAAMCDALEKAEEALAGLDVERFKELSRDFNGLYERARRLALDTRDQKLLNETFLLKHLMADLAAAGEEALLHSHDEAQRRISKDVDYRRYLLKHHRAERP